MEWINPVVRLPEKSGRYLVYLTHGKDNVRLADYNAESKLWMPPENTGYVMYWADAPELPKRPMSLKEKVMFGLTNWHNAEKGTGGCPATTEECEAMGCPYAGALSDCSWDILEDAYKLFTEERTKQSMYDMLCERMSANG